jgi:hypothetical protein
MPTKPNLLIGALAGLMVSAPLIALNSLGSAIAGLPFMPFDFFPVVRDLLPGGLLTFGIDTMVNLILALNLGRLDESAKLAEQAMAVQMLLGVGVVAGVIFFAVMNRSKTRGAMMPGLTVGLVFGVVMALISARWGLSSVTGQPFLDGIWLIVLFMLWGLSLGWIYQRLTTAAPVAARAR